MSNVSSSAPVPGDMPSILHARQMPEVVEQALMHAFDGVAVLVEEKYVWLNEMHHAMYGYSLEESAGMTWRMLYDAAEVERIERDIFPVVAEKGNWQGICRGRRKNGEYFDVELSLAILTGGELVCCCRDVTERVESERRQVQLTEFMAHLTQLLQAQIDHPNLPAFVNKLLSLLAGNTHGPCVFGIVPSLGALEMHATWLFANLESGSQTLIEKSARFHGAREVPGRKAHSENLIREIVGRQFPIVGTEFRPIIHRGTQMAELQIAAATPLPRDMGLFIEAALSVLATVLSSSTLEREKLTLQRREQSTLDELSLVARAVGVIKWSMDLETGRFDTREPILLEEVTGQRALHILDLRHLIVPADFSKVYRAFRFLVYRGDLFDMQFRIKAASGEQRIVRTIALRNAATQGEVAKLTGISYDVTDRYVAGKRLERLEDYYIRLFELTRDGLAFFTWDANDGKYRVARMNRALAVLLGLEAEGDYTEKHVDELLPVPVVTMLKSHEVIEASVSRPHVSELALTRQDATIEYVRLEMGRFGGGEGATVFLRGFDIGEEKRLLREQERITELHETANEELRRASRLKDAFLANMSHELRTPLNGILGACELLSSGACGALEARQSDILSMAEAAGRHLLAIISDILDLSKINSGKMQLAIEAFPLEGVLESVCHFLRPVCAARSVTVQTSVRGSGGLVLESDRVRVTQILTNLLSNAVKFSPVGGEVQIVAWRDESTGDSHLCVCDHGQGIPKLQQAAVFCQFEQAIPGLDRPHEGTGLGLALVRSLVQMLGGRVVVASEFGRGSNFELVLPPNVEQGLPNAIQSRAPQAARMDSLRGGGRRVFIIDAYQKRARRLEEHLLDAGCHCTYFEEISGALLAMRSLNPALIVIELGEPGLLTASSENVEMLVELSREAVEVVGISPVLVNDAGASASQIYGCSGRISTIVAPPWDNDTVSLLLSILAHVERQRLGAA